MLYIIKMFFRVGMYCMSQFNRFSNLIVTKKPTEEKLSTSWCILSKRKLKQVVENTVKVI